MAAGDLTARLNLVQVQFGGAKPRLHANFVREVEATSGEKASMGLCEIEIDIDAAIVKPLADLAKAELARIAADEKGDDRAKPFKDLTIR